MQCKAQGRTQQVSYALFGQDWSRLRTFGPTCWRLGELCTYASLWRFPLISYASINTRGIPKRALLRVPIRRRLSSNNGEGFGVLSTNGWQGSHRGTPAFCLVTSTHPSDPRPPLQAMELRLCKLHINKTRENFRSSSRLITCVF